MEPLPLGPIGVADAEGNYIFDAPVAPEAIVKLAAAILHARIQRGDVLKAPEDTRAFVTYRLSALEHEVFCVLFLDNRHGVIAFEEMFRGTIDGASVPPREVVKRALELNAAATIFAHNHPSGIPEPSPSDMALTKKLRHALETVDIRLLDHIVVGGAESVSFAERGLL